MGVLSDRLKKKDEPEENTEPVTFGLKLKPKMPELVTPVLVPVAPKNILGARLFEQQVKRERIPTYYQQYKKVNEVTPAPVQFGIKQDFNIQTGIKDLVSKKNEPEVEKKLIGIWGGNNPVTKFLIGKGTRPEDLGRDRSFFGDKVPERGLLGFLTGDLLKSDHETAAELYEVFVGNGMDANEAFQKANDSVIEGKAIGLDPEQQQAYLTWNKWEKIGTVLDATFLGADVLTLGGSTILKQGVKTATRAGMAEALKTAAETGNRVAIRDVLLKQYPTIKGSEELEQAIDLIQNTPEDFSWLKIRNEFRNSEVFKDLAKTETPTALDATTEAQKSLFRTGQPTLKTVVGDVDTVVDVRKSITSVLRGEKEATRLSQPDVLASEIRAGALPRTVTADDTVEVFRIGGSGRRAKIGDQVTLSKNLAEEGADSFTVPIKDLVRLEDGTFARVPESQIGKDLTPSIKAVRDVVTREKVVAREQAEKLRMQMERIAQEQAQKKAKQEVIEREARDEAIRLDNEAKITKAREVVESAKTVGKGALTKMKNDAVKATRAIEVTEKKIIKAVQNRTALLRASTAKANLTPGRFVQKFGDYMTVAEKIKVKSGKPLTTAERARIQKRLREAIDKDIDALKANKNELQENWRKAGSDFVKAKSTLKEADEAKKFLAEAGEKAKVVKEKTEIIKRTTTKTKITESSPSKLKPIGSGEKTESTLSQRLIKKAKEVGKEVTPDINTPFYNKATNSEYINNATEYLSKNGVDKSIDAIMDIADEAIPQQIKPALYNVILDTVERTGTPEQMQRMVAALSNISEEGTAAGQIVESLKALHRNNPVMRILDLQSILRQNATRKFGKSAFTDAEKELTEQIAKAGTKEDAVKALEILTCDI